MSNSINPLVQSLLLSQPENPLLLQISQLPPEALEVLNRGDLAQLEIFTSQDGVLQGSLRVNGQSFALSLNESLLALVGQQDLVIPVKIGANGQLHLLKGEPSSTAPVLAISEKNPIAQIELSPLKIAEFVDKTLQEMKVLPAIRQQIVQNISPLPVSIDRVGGEVISNEAVLQPLQNILQQIADNLQNLPVLKPLLLQAVNNLVGQQIRGEVAERFNDMTVVKTPLGETYFDAKVKLPLTEPVLINITQPSSDYSREIKFVDDLLKILLRPKETEVKPEVIARQPQLKNLAALNEMASPSLMPAIINRLPFEGTNLLENIFNFYQASTHKDLSRWLGHELIKSAAADPLHGDKIIGELKTFLTSSLRETPSWRIVEIPLFDGTQFSQVKVAVQKEPDQSKDKAKKQKSGTRFVVETSFSKLGNFQFDGFASLAKRSLDLIVRTSAPLEDDFYANVINLFKKSLYTLDYAGTIKINRQETFINLQEENVLTEGIYI